MLSSYLLMQSSIAAMNNAQLAMVQNSDRMLNSVSFGNSQPLSPAFAQNADSFELQNKANETKITVLQKLADAYEQKLGKDIARSTPKYGGVDYKA